MKDMKNKVGMMMAVMMGKKPAKTTKKTTAAMAANMKNYGKKPSVKGMKATKKAKY